MNARVPSLTRESRKSVDCAEMENGGSAPGIDSPHGVVQRQDVLRRALAKVVVLGQEVGVSTDQMIALLEAGLTVEELLEHLVRRRCHPQKYGSI